MNDFTHRFTRQYMITEIVLGVLFLVVPCVLEMSGLIELDYSRILGILSFFVAPFLIIASIFSYRIIRRFRKGSPDSGSGIANLLWYSVFSLAYIMLMAHLLPTGHLWELKSFWDCQSVGRYIGLFCYVGMSLSMPV